MFEYFSFLGSAVGRGVSVSELLNADWSEAEKQALVGRDYELQTLLTRGREYTITCFKSRDWVEQNITVPDNSALSLYDHSGMIEMGWNRSVDPSGRFTDNDEHRRATSENFTSTPFQVNAFCFLVRIGDNLLTNPEIPEWGASIGPFTWGIGAGQGGRIATAFNDTDYNNTGSFFQTLRIESLRNFALRLQGQGTEDEQFTEESM